MRIAVSLATDALFLLTSLTFTSFFHVSTCSSRPSRFRLKNVCASLNFRVLNAKWQPERDFVSLSVSLIYYYGKVLEYEEKENSSKLKIHFGQSGKTNVTNLNEQQEFGIRFRDCNNTLRLGLFVFHLARLFAEC